MPKSRNINKPRFKWNAWQDAIILATYAHTSNQALCKLFACTERQLYSRAQKHGILKSKWFWQNHPTSGHVMLLPEQKRSVGRFAKGHVPFNKGRKGWCMAGAEKGWFKQGTRPKNWQPIGTTRLMREGYFEVKINTTGHKPTDWIAVHRLVWARCNGTIPKGYVVYFLDGNGQNAEITNLGCISQAQNMARNSMHQYGQEYVRIKQLQAQITRQINKHTNKENGNDQCTNAV